MVVSQYDFRDGRGNVGLKIFWRGVPLAGDGSDLAELVLSAGCGFVVPPADAQALAKTILGAHEKRAELKAMGDAGRAKAERDFSRGVVTGRYEALVSSLAGDGGPQRSTPAVG